MKKIFYNAYNFDFMKLVDVNIFVNWQIGFLIKYMEKNLIIKLPFISICIEESFKKRLAKINEHRD